MTSAPPADPVQELMARHRALCEGAVGPLELAAHLEAEGFGPGTAYARTRHADVFPLAEELYARVPRVPPALRRARVATPWGPLTRTLVGAAVTAGAVLRLAPSQGAPSLGVPSLWLTALLCLPLGLCLALGRPAGSPAGPGATALFAADTAVLAAGAIGSAQPRSVVALAGLTAAAQGVAWGVAAAGRRHLLARSRSDFRSRMSAVLALALVADAGVAAGAGSAHLACAGLLLALCVLLRLLGHLVPALLGAAVGAAGVLIRAPLGWGLALAAVLTACVWALALRPESYRDELPVPL